MFPPVQVTAALASTVNPPALDEPLLDLENSGDELMLDAGLLDVGSLHAAESSASAAKTPAANLECWYVFMGKSPWVLVSADPRIRVNI
jgi:hypothetical protein